MSRKKSNKVKNYIRRKNIFKNICTVILGLIILGTVCFLTFLLMISAVNSETLISHEDMKKLVSITNDCWSDQSLLEKTITAEMMANPSLDQVLFVDDDFEVIRQIEYIRNPEKAGQNSFNKTALNAETLGMFKTTGIYRLYSYFLDFDFDYIRAMRLLNLNDFPTDRPLLDWAESIGGETGDWLIYKTDIPGVNVCVGYLLRWNMLLGHQSGIAIVLLSIFIVILIFSGFIFTVMAIRRNHYGTKIIYTDPVTGGNNRDFFINEVLRKAKKRGRYAVVQFRLEKYRNYCTAYGLKKGEKLLEKIYWAVKQNLGWKEKMAHLEDADYAVLLEYADKKQLEKRLKDMVFSFNEKDRHLHFVAGVYPVQSKREDMTEILTSTALALSKAEGGTANVIWFNDSMKQEQIWERRVEDDMERALKNHEFQVYLQPKYSTKKEKLAAAEALVRWIHPELGFISPGKFIPIFETNGFILKLDDFMLREISKLQAGWLREGKKLVPISVNVSRAHFSMDDLAEHICSIVDVYRVPHEYIELELTESAFFDDKATLLSTVKKLKSYGFKISMDDFGAGYSSLNSLKELPLDIIKLDAEFFRGIDDVKRANAIVGDTIALAKKLGMSIVAEGIETREQVDFLAGQDCDLIQGFYFAKPLSVSEFVERYYQ